MYEVVQMNTSRNEACYKLLNGGILGQKKADGTIEPQTGLQKMNHDGENYYVGIRSDK